MRTIKQTTGLALALVLTLSVFGPALAQDAKTPNLAAYAGHYELAPGAELILTYEANHLFAQLTGQDRFEVFADGPKGIKWMVVDAKADFQTAPDGHITGLTIHQGGQDVSAKKVD
jgi:D-alanyl-D-alanine-carboxypeptidase/D-alanyl-D-alanine-endopeptidase